MWKFILISLTILMTRAGISAQELIGVSTGANYNEQVYYRLNDDQFFNVKNDAWEIGFTTIGQQDAGVFVNESSRTSFGNPQAPIEVYLAPSDDWSDTIRVDELGDRLYNNEKDWTYGGAFNQPRDTSDIFDFGWGEYDFMTNRVKGEHIYVIRLRNGDYKKFQIQSLVVTTYTFRYANLDGSDEIVEQLDKANFDAGFYAFYSFGEAAFIEEIPDSWDLMFCRYITPIRDNNNDPVPFDVTGVLSGFGVEVAEARGIDPQAVSYNAYEDSLRTELDIIGYDWKTFDNGWTLAEDLAYFVKTIDDEVYKIRFLLFGGSATGDIAFEKTAIFTTAVTDVNSNFKSATIYPNPAHGPANLLFELKNAVPVVTVTISDMNGSVVGSYQTGGTGGLNAIVLNDLPTAQGMYFVTIASGDEFIQRKLLIP